jgi:phospholipid transport system substrate-binding protein
MQLGILSLMMGVVMGAVGTQPGPDPNDPEALLKDRLAAVIRILENDELDLAAKEAGINRLVQTVFDFELMSYLTLGKKQWTQMSPAQRKRFVELFVARLKASYRDKLSMYSGEKIVYKPPLRKGTKIQIPTELVTPDQHLTILYKMYEKRKRGWKIYDVEVQGVSLITTYRVQFKEVLSQGTLEDLLQKLKEQPGEGASAKR